MCELSLFHSFSLKVEDCAAILAPAGSPLASLLPKVATSKRTPKVKKNVKKIKAPKLINSDLDFESFIEATPPKTPSAKALARKALAHKAPSQKSPSHKAPAPQLISRGI